MTQPIRTVVVTQLEQPSIGRHMRRCGICKHSERFAIEEDFIHWRSPSEITVAYELEDRSTVYRHARAFNLYPLRKRNLRFVVEHILEQAEEVPITGNTLLRAVRTYARITDDGEWIEPPLRIRVARASIARAAAAGVEELTIYPSDARLPANSSSALSSPPNGPASAPVTTAPGTANSNKNE
jgi:hypothetical protein